MTEQAGLSFGRLLRQLRAEARLTQEELADAAQLSPRSVSDLERGINRTARKDTAELLADALDLAGLTRELFVAAARGRGPAEDVLAAREGKVAWGMRACPYRGLLPFSESDAEVFYGRERLTAELAMKLIARMGCGGLVVVTGASGSGKTSLLQAGLLPILARGQQIPGSDRWPRMVMTPTKDPLTELAAHLAAVGGPDALAVRDELARHPDRAHLAVRSAVLAAVGRRDAARAASGDDAARLVLIIDQFEQVFTLNPDLGGEATRQAFITALCSAAASPAGPRQEPPALVVITVRGDFWDRCAAVPELVAALQDGQFVVGPMTEAELRVAITGPAETAGLRIDSALTDTILGDLRVAGEDRSAGVLPLLSQAMALTWEHREGDRLTSRGYAHAGGVSHAVQTGADRLYDGLPSGHQAIARDVLRSMTVASRDGWHARRPVTREDIYLGLPGAARSDIDAVLDAFAAERLAVLDDDRVQIAHDVLLRAWPRMRGWLEEDQASWILHNQLADAAIAWDDSNEDPSFLYRGTQLAAFQQAITRWSADPARSPALTATQRGFLQACERAAARTTRRRRGGFALLALLTAAAVAAAGFAFAQQATAIRQRDQAIYNQVIAEALQYATSDTPLAAQLTLAAYHIQPTQDLATQLLNTENLPLPASLATGARVVNSVAFSPGGRELASGDADGAVQLWNVAAPGNPSLLGQFRTSGTAAVQPALLSVQSVAFSPDGRTVASGDAAGAVRLWNVTDPSNPSLLGQPPTTGTAAIHSVAFSPDGRTLASGDAAGAVRLWNVTDATNPSLLGQPLTTGAAAVQSVAFSRDGRTLATGHFDGVVRLWDLADPAHPHPLGQPLSGVGTVNSVAFSPDGRTLASGDWDGVVRLWDLADPAHPNPLGQPLSGVGAVNSVAFSPDGHTLASGSLDGTVRLWDVANPARPSPLSPPVTGGTAAIQSVAFSSDGHTLASGDAEGTIRLWNVPQTVLTGSTVASNVVAFSRDGHTLASGDSGGTIRLWDTADPARPRPIGPRLDTGTAGVQSVTFSADRRTLAIGDYSGTVRLWDISDPAHPRALGQPLARRTPIQSLAFSPKGHMLASGDDGGTVGLWDVSDPAHPRLLAQSMTAGIGAILTVAFSPDGRTLASGSAGGAVQLWDLADPAHVSLRSQPSTTGTAVRSVAFSPDGRMLVSGDFGGTVQLWDVTDPAHPRVRGQAPTGSVGVVSAVAFSHDGRTVASGSLGGAIRLWDVTDPADPSARGQPLTSSTASVDSVAFSPDGRTLASASADGTTRLWNLDIQYAIERICATAGGLTPRQWNRYIPQLQYQPSCAH